MDKAQPELKTQKALWRGWRTLTVILGIASLLLVALLFWCYFSGTHTTAEETAGDVPTAAAGPCTGGVENIVPAGFTFYENASLGYKFAYPSAWGTVSVSTTPIASESGDYVMGHFSANDSVWFGGNATDYVVGGREGLPTDLPGYLKVSGNYYTVGIWRFSDGSTTESRSELYPIDPPHEEKAGCNTVALVTQWPASELSSIGPADIARFNLPSTSHYYGVNFVIDKPTAAARAEFDKLIHSFEILSS